MDVQSSHGATKRNKLLGTVLAVTAILAVAVLCVHQTSNDMSVMSLKRAQALAHVDNAHLPISQLPDESSLKTPKGWEIESDEPIEGPHSQEQDEQDLESGRELEENVLADEDDDIDFPMEMNEDANGQKFVAILSNGIIAQDGEDQSIQQFGEAEVSVASDGKRKRSLSCYKNFRSCAKRRICRRKCLKKCRPVVIRTCNSKKFCRCFCKNAGHKRKARKCVFYKRKRCKRQRTYKCKRGCQKFCRKVPKCFCCHSSKVMKQCMKTCKKMAYASKCKNCRCSLVKCVKRCRFVCSGR